MDSLNSICVQLVHNTGYNLVDSCRETIHSWVHNMLNITYRGISPTYMNRLPYSLHTGLSTTNFATLSGVRMELSPVSTEPIITTITYIIRKEQL